MKLLKLNEYYSVGSSILMDAIADEKGIAKDILETIKNNLSDNVSLDTLKKKIEELKDKGTETGILPKLEYDIEKLNFYIQHREEIETILKDNNWINDNKSEWSSKLELIDIIIFSVNFAIEKVAEKILQEYFN